MLIVTIPCEIIEATTILTQGDLRALAIHAGHAGRIFLDDMYYPFKTNPHFKAWLPIVDTPNCWLIVNGQNRPILAYYQPLDFWHKVSKLSDDYWTRFFDIKLITDADEIAAVLPDNKQGIVYIGAHQDIANDLGFTDINPESVLNYFHYHRAYKTDYEFVCMREANRLAVLGHEAAKTAFYNQGSEFDIQLAYLQATGHSENEVPYGNIIALNENTATLHYTSLEETKPSKHLSFLIDAGACFHGYAADITRTYSFNQDEFADLIVAMNEMQLELVQGLKPGTSYVDLHIQNHYLLAAILQRFDLVNLGAQAMVSKGITGHFFPHGLGHHLGFQVHDMGGFMADDKGTHVNPPSEHPFLRTSRGIEGRQVFTIEPGLYFIKYFLSALAKSENAKYINWDKVDSFRKYGGIRIEDNVIVHQDRLENMTRNFNLA
ncbi:Xaa-Pro dipeptidase [Thalassotalea sp. 42_200_T64]|nr:Xaa-Pro dipeptidase [Thalassotalea sp. 42_200_T64]